MAAILRPCPSCKIVGKLHKSHSRNSFEKFLSATRIVGFYRCHNCGWRGFLFRKKKIHFSFAGLAKTIVLLLIVYYFVLYILRNYTN